MKYIIDVVPWSAETNISYSRELHDLLAETAKEWIHEHIEYPGNWVTYTWVEEELPLSPPLRIN